MSKKTFFSVLWLMAGCGVLAALFFVVVPRRENKPESLVWKTKAYKQSVHQLAFTADGKTLVSKGLGAQQLWDYALVHWDTLTGRRIRHSPLAGFTQLSADARWLAAVNRGTLVGSSVNKPQSPVHPKSPIDERLQYFRSNQFRINQSIEVGDIDSGRLKQSITLPDESVDYRYTVGRIFISHNNAYIATTLDGTFATDGIIKRRTFYVWDLQSGKTVSRKELSATDHKITSYHPDNLIFSNRERTFFSVEDLSDHFVGDGKNCQFRLRDELTGKTTVFTAPGFPARWSQWDAPLLSPDEQKLVVLYDANSANPANDLRYSICLFDRKTQKLIWKHNNPLFVPRAVTFSADGATIAFGGYDYSDKVRGYASKGKLILLDARTGIHIEDFSEETWQDKAAQQRLEQISRISFLFKANKPWGQKSSILPGDSGPVTALAFSPDGSTLAAGYGDGSIKLWRVPQK